MAAVGAGQGVRRTGGDAARAAGQQHHRAGAERWTAGGGPVVGQGCGNGAQGGAGAVGAADDDRFGGGAQFGEEVGRDAFWAVLGVDVHGADQHAGVFEGRRTGEAAQPGAGQGVGSVLGGVLAEGAAGRGGQQQPPGAAGQGGAQSCVLPGQYGTAAGPQGAEVHQPAHPVGGDLGQPLGGDGTDPCPVALQEGGEGERHPCPSSTTVKSLPATTSAAGRLAGGPRGATSTR